MSDPIYNATVHIYTKIIVKPGARRPQRAWFIEITSVRMYVCLCVRPRGDE